MSIKFAWTPVLTQSGNFKWLSYVYVYLNRQELRPGVYAFYNTYGDI